MLMKHRKPLAYDFLLFVCYFGFFYFSIKQTCSELQSSVSMDINLTPLDEPLLDIVQFSDNLF